MNQHKIEHCNMSYHTILILLDHFEYDNPIVLFMDSGRLLPNESRIQGYVRKCIKMLVTISWCA